MDVDDVDCFYLLFMMPGFEHCFGGPGPGRVDLLGALVDWVEHGRAPDRVVASGTTPTGAPRTRPLCPHPQVARYNGSGSSDEEANFTCETPAATAGGTS